MKMSLNQSGQNFCRCPAKALRAMGVDASTLYKRRFGSAVGR